MLCTISEGVSYAWRGSGWMQPKTDPQNPCFDQKDKLLQLLYSYIKAKSTTILLVISCIIQTDA